MVSNYFTRQFNNTTIFNMKKILFFLSLIIIFQNCRPDNGVGAEAGVYDVDPAFESYVQAFIAEGAKRGQTIDFDDSGLIVEFSDVTVGNASGFCYVGEHHVVIDKSEWTSLSENVRGFLLFHELGHCELDRGHRNDKFENNVWKSIMRGSPLEGNEVWIPIPYFGFRKDYLNDELFNENVPAPAWATQTFDYNEVPAAAKEVVNSAENINRINQRFSDLTDEYELEIDFSVIRNRPNRTKLIWGNTTNHYYIEFFPETGFNLSGFFIGVHQDSQDNGLFYSTNTININGAPLSKITIRREGGFEKVFMNEEFIFHIDLQENPIGLVRMEATTPENTIDNTFEIQRFEARKIN